MRLPNLLVTQHGRLTAFFLLYVTEGIPLGFVAIAVATQLRRHGTGPAEIGALVASFYLPWAFKWAFGPFIDVFASDRIGRRRGWIIGTQLLMAATLLSAVWLKLPQQLGLFTAVVLVHNCFGAMQDVAIDALAVGTLHEDERGIANGLMFGGAQVGNMLGGAGVLFLTQYVGFQATFFFVAAAILAVTVFVVLPMTETPSGLRRVFEGSKLHSAAREMREFALDSFRSFLGTRGAFSGLWFALLPAGAMCLTLALQSNLAVELGLNDDQVAWLNLGSTLINGGCCVLGGWLSDRYGRRRTLGIFIALQSVPVLYLMHALSRQGWVMPIDMNAAGRPAVPHELLMVFWIATLVYNAFNGLMYGVRSAIFMDVTNPAVAATQFTAYMALINLTISYSASWQGIAIEAWGYPRTMLVDALFGLVSLAILPWMKASGTATGASRWADASAATRARGLALVLAIGCAAWLPYAHWQTALGAAQPITGTFFTLIFIASALFLLAGAAVIGRDAPWLSKLAPWVAPLLLLMSLRYFVDSIANGLAPLVPMASFKAAMPLVFDLIALAGGALLLLYSLRPWQQLGGSDPSASAAVIAA